MDDSDPSPGLLRQGIVFIQGTLDAERSKQILGREIGTVCGGGAAGPAVLLLAAGMKGKRSAYPHARVGIHRSEASLRGTTA